MARRGTGRGARTAALLLGLMVGGCTAKSEPAGDSAAAGGAGDGLDEDRPRDTGNDRPIADDLLADTALQPAVLAAIEGAERELRVAQYTIWSGNETVDALVDAVGAAAARGVAVWVLADETSDGIETLLDGLAAQGAQVQLDSPDRTTHNKLWIIDDTAFSGSHNLSWSALSSNRELSLRTDDPVAVGALRDWYDALWADPAALHPVEGDAIATDDGVIGAVIGCLDGATERVRVVMYAAAWDDRYPGGSVDRVLGAVEAAHGRGVDVQVVLDDSEWIRDNGINDAAEARLVAAGVPLRRAAASEVVHAKVVVCDDRTLASDANWSYSGLELYHGATLVRDDAQVAAAAAAWADGIWDLGRTP